jgi:AAA ATPase domain
MTQFPDTINPSHNRSQPKPKALTEIGVGVFKSFTNLTKIKLGALSILAGANSSGKSSIMQPLLLMKQTIEAPYDPGILLLDGPNVQFTSSEQFISTQSLAKDEFREFQIFIAIEDLFTFQSVFQWSVQTGLAPHSQTYCIGDKKSKLWLDMTSAEIKKQVVHVDRVFDNQQVIRERCFLIVQEGRGRYGLSSEAFSNVMRSMIHVPGVRGNPERIYKTAATDGNTFAGLFENYVVSVIDRFQKKEPEKLAQLQSHLQKLGLTLKFCLWLLLF